MPPADSGEVPHIHTSLELARQRCAELYDAAPVAYITWDRNGVICDLNLAAVELLRVAKAHAIGLPFRGFVALGSAATFSTHLLRFREVGEASTDLRIVARRAAPLDVQLRSRHTSEGQDLCFTSLIDLSGQRRGEQERNRLEHAEQVLREANLAKDRFIASLSHELRAPLAPVLAAIASLEEHCARRPEARRLVDIIRRSTKHQARLIDDLLDVSRIVANKMHIEAQPADAHQAASEALEMVGADLRARRLDVTVGLEAARHHVNGDPVRLRQVFVNLVKNAVKFTPEGGHVWLRSWNSGDRVVLEVADDGRGIDAALLSTLFDPFRQGEDLRDGTGGGLGLGLTICKGIVDLHGGKLAARSPGPGRGSRFVVELPALAKAPAIVEPASPERPPRRPRPPFRAHILLVEDDPNLAAVLQIVLSERGYHVHKAHTGKAALSVDLSKVDVMISDIALPDLDGRELLRRLRRKQELSAVALSGFGTEADVRASEEAGFLRHLTKPVEAPELLDAIEWVLGQSHDHAPPRRRGARAAVAQSRG